MMFTLKKAIPNISYRKLMVSSLFFFLFSSVFVFTGNSSVSAQYSDPSFIMDTNCRTATGPKNDFGVVHVNTNWRNSLTFETGRAYNVNVEFNSDLPETGGQTRTGNTGGNGRTCWGGLRCDYVHTGGFDGTYTVEATSDPSGLPGGGTWSSASGTMRNDIPLEARLTYTFTPKTWSYNPSTSVSKTNIRHGESVDITGTTENTGNGTGASYNSIIEREEDNSGHWYDQRADNNELGLTAGSSRSRITSYTAPHDISNTTEKVCFNTRVSPYAGNSDPSITVTQGGWRNSGEECVTISSPIWEYEHNSFTTSPSPPSTVRHGATVNVNNIIKNIGTTRGIKYDHDIRVKLGTDAYKNLTSWSNVGALYSNATHNKSASYYPVPNNVPNGTQLCFKGRIKPFKGRRIHDNVNQTTSSGWRESVERCITINTPPPDFTVSANCSTISVGAITDGVDPLKNMTVTVGSIEVYNGPVGSRAARDFSYPPAGQTHTDHTVSVSVTDNIDNTTTKTKTVTACYAVSCTDPMILGKPILATNDFDSEARYKNTGGLDWGANKVRARAQFVRGNMITENISPGLAIGSTRTVTFSPFTARPDLDKHQVNMSAQYERVLQNGSTTWTDFGPAASACNATFDPYTEFELTPVSVSSQLKDTKENPDTFHYKSEVTAKYEQVPDANVGISNPKATRRLSKNGTKLASPSSTGVYARTFEDTAPAPKPHSADDRYCGNIHLDFPYGWVNKAGNVINLAGPAKSDGDMCDLVVDQPYVSAFGADVIAGNDFGDDCDAMANKGIISAFFDKDPNRGSGAQFAAIAMTQITGFTSAKMRNGAPITPVKGLSIANAGTPPADSTYGGGYPGTHCVTDYYGREQVDELPTVSSATPHFVDNNDGAHKIDNVALTHALNIPNGKNFALYSDGDMQIKENIQFDNTSSWSDPEDIPSFYLIVRGDIYITNNVTHLDGVYIAQPHDGSGGNIYTCATGASPKRANQMFNQCTNVLEVNGAFIADTIKLNRYAHSSLRYGNNTEYLRGTGNRLCADGSRPVCAAEIFNFSPELYLAKPALTPTSIPGQGKYDAVTSLPPVL